MKNNSLVIAVLISTFCYSGCQHPEVNSLSVGREVPVIGRLGVALGTVVEVEACIVEGDTLRTKDSSGDYLLDIKKVGPKVMKKPVLSHFQIDPWNEIALANDPFSLYKLIGGVDAHELSSDDVERFAKGYVGSRCRLVVFETGGFSGMPDGLPQDYPLMQDHGFGFTTRLVVVRVLEHNWRPNKALLPATTAGAAGH